MEKTCKKCGKTLPIEMFPLLDKVHRRGMCKDCYNAYIGEYRKKHPRIQKDKEKDSLKCALKRERLKADTGRTYRNEKEAKRSREYAVKYQEEHKYDPKHVEKRRKYCRNYDERRKMKEEVEILGEFFSNYFEL